MGRLHSGKMHCLYLMALDSKLARFRPGACIIKLIRAVIYAFPLSARFLFLASLSSLVQCLWVRHGAYPTHKHQTRLERHSRDKHSSLLRKSANYGRKVLQYRYRSVRQNRSNLAKFIIRGQDQEFHLGRLRPSPQILDWCESVFCLIR